MHSTHTTAFAVQALVIAPNRASNFLKISRKTQTKVHLGDRWPGVWGKAAHKNKALVETLKIGVADGRGEEEWVQVICLIDILNCRKGSKTDQVGILEPIRIDAELRAPQNAKDAHVKSITR